MLKALPIEIPTASTYLGIMAMAQLNCQTTSLTLYRCRFFFTEITDLLRNFNFFVEKIFFVEPFTELMPDQNQMKVYLYT